MTDFIAALADLILPELMGGYAPEYVFKEKDFGIFSSKFWENKWS